MKRALLFTLAVALFTATVASAVSVPIEYTEPVAAANDLLYCTIYQRVGAGMGWYPVKDVARTATSGGGVVATSVDRPLVEPGFPTSWYFAVSCTNTAKNQGPRLASGNGNPVIFE